MQGLKLAFALLFVALRCVAACTNMLVTFEGGTNGQTVTAAILTNSSFGFVAGTWSIKTNIYGTNPYPGGLTFTNVAQHAFPAGTSMDVCNASRNDGSGSIGLISTITTNDVIFTCQYLFTATHQRVSLGAWVNWSFNDQNNHDILGIYGNDGFANGLNNFLVSNKGLTNFIQNEIYCSPCLPNLTNSTGHTAWLTNQTWYWVALYYTSLPDAVTMQARVYQENASGQLELVAASACTNACPTVPADHISVCVSNHGNGDMTQYVLYDNVMINAEENPVYPLLPTTIPGTISSATISGGASLR